MSSAEIAREYQELRQDASFWKIPTYDLAAEPYWFLVYRRAFKIFTKLWEFQQANRAILTDTGRLKRWEIGKLASRIGQLYYHYLYKRVVTDHRVITMDSMKTSNRKYLEEALGFYEAIHERAYFHSSSNPGEDVSEHRKRFLVRYAAALILAQKTDKAAALSKSLGAQFPSLLRLCTLLSVDTVLPTNMIRTKVMHAIIVTGRSCEGKFGELTVGSCHLHYLLDRCMNEEACEARNPIRVCLEKPSFPSLVSIVSSSLDHVGRDSFLLLWQDHEDALTPEDVAPFIRRGYKFCIYDAPSSRFTHLDPALLHDGLISEIDRRNEARGYIFKLV